MHKKHGSFPQPTPSSIWEVNNIPEGAIGSVVTHVETDDGIILQPDDQMRASYGLQLSFGVREVSGVAYYDYYVKDDNTVVEHDGNVVNIYMNPKT